MGVYDLLENLYRQIPKFKCVPGCTDCCGPVPWSSAEEERVRDKKEQKGIECPYAGKRGCEIYEARPFMCRLFGASHEKMLKCPHGRGPLFPLTVDETRRLTDIYIGIAGRKKTWER